MTDIRGHYLILNEAFLREKANRSTDPRHKFYEAMLASRSYGEYLARVGRMEVEVPTFKTGPINGRMEILYARRRRWIQDE